jgi:hypothetical protein
MHQEIGGLMLRKTALVALLALLTGCANTYNTQTYGPIDLSNKTVTVPFGSGGLKGKLKQSLANNGWKLISDKGPSVTEGTMGEKTRIEHYDTFNSRYRLIVSSQQFDLCLLTQSPAINFDVSFIDNKSGAEVFTIGGTGCESIVVALLSG